MDTTQMSGAAVMQQPHGRRGMLKSVIMAVLAIAVIAGILIAGYVYFAGTSSDTGPVARVNGVEVPRDHYVNTIRTLVQSASAQGYDLNDSSVQTAIQAQALSALINGELLLQEAKKNNIAASDEEVQAQYDALVTQLGGQDKLDAQLQTNNITDAALREDIGKQIAIQKYLNTQLGAAPVTVSEDEITAYYNQLVQSGQQMPDMASVHDTLKQQLTAQKQQNQVASLIESLRTQADVEVLI